MFQNSGYRAHLSDGARTAREILREIDREVALILVDWHLGVGQTAATILPELLQELDRPVPVLILSGDGDLTAQIEQVDSTLGGMPIGFLQKPAGSEALRQAIDALLANR